MKKNSETEFPSKFPRKYKFIEADVDIQMTTSKFKDSFVTKSRTYTMENQGKILDLYLVASLKSTLYNICSSLLFG